ncbi:15-cis-zeta-carotene isomerase, chloroplastic [Carya illinoinensis]|nr:15-cis-zeta-carotene isomerase, chloroplastic [Carya illinoinensis]
MGVPTAEVLIPKHFLLSVAPPKTILKSTENPKSTGESATPFRCSSLWVFSPIYFPLSLHHSVAMATTLVFSNPYSPLPHRPFGNKRSTHLLRRPASTLKTLLIPSFKESFHSSLFASNSLPLFTRRFQLAVRISTGDTETKKSSDDDDESSPVLLMGEDSASFDLAQQKISSWIYFSLILGVVLFVLDFVWIDNSTGLGKAFVDAVSGLSGSHEVVMLTLILIFAIVHSGLASLRDGGEKLIGERAFRVLFAGTSLPLAVSTIVYFINHRYDGQQLWQLQSVPGLHQFVWLSSFISFFFLYPSTFNLLEVAAVEKPKMHLWETGIMRITRHPQMVGQVVWCLAHTLWIGNSVVVAASVGLIGHHLFGVWNGDRRLAIRYGEAFESVKRRTSVIPFAAILEGRQKLPKEYYKEFIRVPYLTITALTLGAYFAHPLMQAASFGLHW